MEIIVLKLRKKRNSFNGTKVKHLRLFGSVARGEAGKDSDIDIMADFDGYDNLADFAEARTIAETSIGREYNIDFVAKHDVKDEIVEVALNEGIEIF